jgi:hypothetical protein
MGMRARSGVAVAMALALAGFAATSAFGVTNTLDQEFGVKLIKQPPGQPWAIGLNVHSVIDTTTGEKPSTLKSITFLFPHAKVNAKYFKTCDPVKLGGAGPKACPAGSKLGSGTALADARPLVNPVHATITMYNAKPKNGNPVFIFYAQATEVAVNIVIQAELKRSSGKYGYRLEVPIPRIPTLPGQDDASIHEIDVDVAASTRYRGKTVYLLQAPTSCPAGGFPFQTTFGFYDDSSLTSNSAISCTLSTKSKA